MHQVPLSSGGVAAGRFISWYRSPGRARPGVLAAVAAAIAALVLPVGASPALAQPATPQKVARIPIRTDGPKNLDPAKGSTTYDNFAISQVYETLLQIKYLKRVDRPKDYAELSEPLLLAEMPKVEDRPDGTQVWSFTLRPDARFHDDPCFPGGKGRTVTSEDVFYSWRRLADPAYEYENYWVLADTIVGLDEYKAAQAERVAKGQKFDYAAPIEGFRAVSERQFQVVLKRPVVRFGWVLSMFQTSIVAREAVERYGDTLGKHPVGTGPFILAEESDWVPGQQMILHRNPNYYDQRYPAEHMPEDAALGLDKPAGQRLPILDRIEITFYVPDPAMWQDFMDGKLGFVQVPAEYFEQAYIKRTQKLRDEFARRGIVAQAVPLLDFIFIGFNMEDKVLGGYAPERIKLRQAICLAMDLQEINDAFYNGLNTIYDGPIPPGLDGYPPDGEAPVSNRGPDLARAKRLLAEAGFPDGKGLPEITLYSSKGGNNAEQMQMFIRQLARIGVRINPRFVDFSELIEATNNKRTQMFTFAWGTDYPDAENNLAMFYGPNAAPGANHFNYNRPEFDEIYRRILVMKPGPERTALMEQLRDMTIRDAAYVGSMGRTRYYLSNPWLKNFKPSEDFYNWLKYLDVDDSRRAR
ncbi:MAG: hypothetical protein KIT68_02070 [Phycisphaeraceae bacterium]|nr:hypothetical protein [Phycisphaeraceae bacterium]